MSQQASSVDHLMVYISARMYEHLAHHKPYSSTANEYYVYETRLVTLETHRDGDEVHTYCKQLKAIHPNERKEAIPELFKYEEKEFIAKSTLCGDYVAAFKSVKGYL